MSNLPTLPISGELKSEHLPAVYAALAEPLEEAAVQTASKDVTKKGYDMTGYKYQYLVNRLNEVAGLDHWHVTHIVEGIDGYQTGRGTQMYEARIMLTVMLGNWGADNFRPLASRTCYGGHQSMTQTDALKGAWTNAFKKTVALFGLGRQAYEQTIDEDYAPAPDAERANPAKPKMTALLTKGQAKAPAPAPAPKSEHKDHSGLRTAFVAACNAKGINYHKLLARMHQTITTHDLSDEQLHASILLIGQDIYDKLAETPLPTGKQALLEGIEELFRQIAWRLFLDDSLRADGWVFARKDEYLKEYGKPSPDKLTIEQLREVGAKLRQVYLDNLITEPAPWAYPPMTIDQMKRAWWKAHVADAPSLEEAERAQAASLGLGQVAMHLFGKGFADLSPEECGELIGRLQAGEIDVLLGRMKEATSGDAE